MLPRGKTLVEIGCGTGGLLRAAAGIFEQAIGIELLIDRLRTAKKLTDFPNVQFLLVDMDNGLPFRDASVSCVVCLATFEDAYDPFYLLDEIHRVLVPRGWFLLQVVNLVWLPRRVQLVWGRLPATGSLDLMQNRCWNGGFLHSYTLHDIRMLLSECGFEIADLDCSGRLSMIAKLWPSLLASDLLIQSRKCDDSSE